MAGSHTEGQSIIDGLMGWLSQAWLFLALLVGGAARVENIGLRLKRTEDDRASDRTLLEKLVQGQAETNERLARMEGRMEGNRK